MSQNDLRDDDVIFNLERMKRSLESPTIKIPDNIKTREEIMDFILSVSIEDDYECI